MDKSDRPVKKKEGVDHKDDDPEFKVECEEYIKDIREFQLWRGCWEENQSRAYHIVLQHCPPKLETRLTTQPKWDQV